MYKFVKIRDNRLNLNYKEWFLYCEDYLTLLQHTEDYMSNTIEKGIRDLLERRQYHPNTGWRSYIETLSNAEGISCVTASLDLENKVFLGKMKALDTYKSILLRDSGSYMILSDDYQITEGIYSDKLIYPNYSIEDIKIVQWQGGKHHYAKIGNLDVVIDGEQKWNSYGEAYEKAKEYLIELNK